MTTNPDNWKPWKLFLAVESVALLIGLIMPVTPSKTGSDWDLADIFFENPGYFQQALISFLFTNLILAVLGMILIGIWWWQERKESKN